MTKNPFYNALFAIAYIVVLVTLVFNSQRIFPHVPDSVFIPMGMLSLLVISAALMAYLFFYQPVLLLLDHKREEGIKLFLKTVGIFAGGAAILFIISLIFS